MYHHTQPASHITVFCLIALLVLLLVFWVAGRDAENPSASREDQTLTLSTIGIAAFVMLLVVSLFHSLTVFDDGESINLRFGIGLITRKVRFDRIKAVKTMKHPWWHGLGVHRIAGGWAYSVAGSDVVELTLKSGEIIRIGTNEPRILLQVIQSHLSSQSKSKQRYL